MNAIPVTILVLFLSILFPACEADIDVKNGLPVQTHFTIQFLNLQGQPLLADLGKEYVIKAGSLAYSIHFEGEDGQSNIHLAQSNTFDLNLGLYVKGDINENLGTLTK